MFQLTN